MEKLSERPVGTAGTFLIFDCCLRVTSAGKNLGKRALICRRAAFGLETFRGTDVITQYSEFDGIGGGTLPLIFPARVKK
jgi:hypothetical protein